MPVKISKRFRTSHPLPAFAEDIAVQDGLVRQVGQVGRLGHFGQGLRIPHSREISAPLILDTPRASFWTPATQILDTGSTHSGHRLRTFRTPAPHIPDTGSAHSGHRIRTFRTPAPHILDTGSTHSGHRLRTFWTSAPLILDTLAPHFGHRPRRFWTPSRLILDIGSAQWVYGSYGSYGSYDFGHPLPGLPSLPGLCFHDSQPMDAMDYYGLYGLCQAGQPPATPLSPGFRRSRRLTPTRPIPTHPAGRDWTGSTPDCNCTTGLPTSGICRHDGLCPVRTRRLSVRRG